MDNSDKKNRVILSSVVIQGLQYLCSEMILEVAKKVIENSIKLTLCPDANNDPVIPELYNTVNSNIIKQCEYSIVTLFALATRHSLDNFELRRLLGEHDIVQNMVEELIFAYDKHRDDFILKQLHTGKYLPIITDIQWRILTDIKSSSTSASSPSKENIGDIHFNINLGEYGQQNGERETIAEFVCNTEEMQHLINKLKEIERDSNKLANE